MECKRYYWLKLQHDIFTSKRLKKLRKEPNGDTCLLIYLKMQLATLETDGVLTFSGLEPTFAEEMALDIEEDVTLVGQTLNFLLDKGLMETEDNIHFLLPYARENTGSETASAQRGRDFRSNMTEEQKDQERERARLAMQHSRQQKKEDADVTNVLRTVTNKNDPCYERVTNVEKEKEKESEKEPDIYMGVTSDKPKTPRAQFKKPTLDEVKAYIWEKGYKVNAEAWYAHYESNGWMVGKNKMKSWQSSLAYWNSGDSGRNPGKTSGKTSYTDAVMHRMDAVKEWASNTDEGGMPFV